MSMFDYFPSLGLLLPSMAAAPDPLDGTGSDSQRRTGKLWTAGVIRHA
jgi:hypothetical protein